MGSGVATAAAPNQVVINVDIDEAVIRRGGGLGAAADAARLPFRPGSFHGALLKDVLEHVPDPVEVLDELSRAATRDARIIVTVPRAVPRAVWADPTHLRGFTKRSICRTLEMAGWLPQGRIDRVGSLPGAGRFPLLLEHSHQVLRLPGLGHRLGLNWLVMARLATRRGD